MKQRYQHGSGSVTAVVMLLVFGLLLLNALHRQLDDALLTGNSEQRYLRAYNQALSSLNWGLSHTWKIVPSSIPLWHCEERPGLAVRACIKPTIKRGLFLIKGESKALSWQGPILLYQQVVSEKQFTGAGKYKMVATASGMLDFCPEDNEKFCAG